MRKEPEEMPTKDRERCGAAPLRQRSACLRIKGDWQLAPQKLVKKDTNGTEPSLPTNGL